MLSAHETSHKTLESVRIIGYHYGTAGDKSFRGGLLTTVGEIASFFMFHGRLKVGLRVKMCVWLGVSRGLDLAFLNAD